jgi:AraC family transcriptional regulator, ethanolamine operon transcriptional activator
MRSKIAKLGELESRPISPQCPVYQRPQSIGIPQNAATMTPSSRTVQPAVTIVDIDDLTVASAGMDLLEQDAVGLTSTPLNARRIIVRLKSIAVVYHSANLRIRTRTKVHEGMLAYVTFGPRSSGMVEGLKVRPGTMLVAEPMTEAGFVVDAGWESITLLVPPDVIRKQLALRQRKGEFHWPRGVEVLQTHPARARELFSLGKRLTTLASRNPAHFNEGRVERDAAQLELLDVLLFAMRSADSLEPAGPERTRRAYSKIVRVAEDHVLSHAEEHVRVADLCRAADVSERTLECAFRQVMDVSPMAFLKRLRLHRVRAALLAAEQASTRVSHEALKWGFWHFGDFSRAYRRCFGELPSHTLRRSPVSSNHVRKRRS